MKKIVYISIALTALMAVSCQKEKDIHPVGSRIVFSAATGYMNGGEPTRTVYSGDLTGTLGQSSPVYERIDWLNTDKIDILYKYAAATTSSRYGISSITSASSGDRENTASIAVENNYSPLEWQGGGTHVFYGLYPAGAGTFDASSPGKITGLEIPYRQTVTKCNEPGSANLGKYLPKDMSKAYMVAYADKSSDPESTVSLPFTPVMTAIQFRLHLPDQLPSYQVSKVRINSSSALSGTYAVNISGFNSTTGAVNWSVVPNSIVAHTGTNEDDSIIVEFEDGTSTDYPDLPGLATASGNQTSTQDYLDFTVFVLPQTISSLDLLIKYTDGSSTIKKVTLNSLSLSAGKKYIITNGQAGYDDFTYSVESISGETILGHKAASFTQISVDSRKISGADNTTYYAAGWKVQYKNSQNQWSDVGNGNPAGYTITPNFTNNTLDVALNSDNTTAASQADNNTTPYAASVEILKARDPQGQNSPYDLSTRGGNISQTTANCYVVTAPGTYMFPCVYGNARFNGANNPDAYYPEGISGLVTTSGSTDETQNYFLPRFYNAIGIGINDPYVVTDLNQTYTVSDLRAEVVWRDTQSTISPEVIDITTGEAPTSSSSGENIYIKFTISPQNITPGNIVIALEGSLSGYNLESWPVFWSWHIWVTDKDFTPSNGVLSYNLGWVDADETVTGAVTRYSDRSLTLRIVALENDTEKEYGGAFTLTQHGDAYSINNPSKGKNPHYQWGRKDPYNYNASTIQLVQSADVQNPYVYWRGIRIPEVMLKSEKSTTWMDGKAVPLYTGSAISGKYWWTIKQGKEKYGPFTSAQKNSLTGTSFNPTGTTWTERTTQELSNYTVIIKQVWFPQDKNNIKQYCGIGDSKWDTDDNGTTYYIKVNTTLTIAQRNNFVTCYENGMFTYGNTTFNPSIAAMSCYNNFINNCLRANYTNQGTGKWDLSLNGNPYPYGPHYQDVADILINTPTNSDGIFNGNTEMTFEQAYGNFSYTTNASRNVGSILYNLWSGSLINEGSTVSSKVKTVYDPCPVGFTVPTRATYLGNATLSSNKTATVSGFTNYPQTGCRMNAGSGGNESKNMNSNGIPTGFYWTDHPCNMKFDGVTSSNNESSYPRKDDIDSYLYQQDAYMLHTQSDYCSLVHFTRGTAASIRPMVDPGASGLTGNPTPVEVVSSPNNPSPYPIENVTFGSEL